MTQKIDRAAYWAAAPKAEIVRAAEMQFGEKPNRTMSSQSELRFGTNGSKSVVLIGKDPGAWNDFESDEGGFLTLTDDQFAGVTGRNGRRFVAPPPDQETIRQREAEDAAKRESTRTYALSLWDDAADSDTDTAAAYLKTRLGMIPSTLGNAPLRQATLKHGPSKQTFPAMIALVTNVRTGKRLAIHRTFLKPDGTGKADVDQNKMLLGSAAGGGIAFGTMDTSVILTEGIEDALTVGRVVEATPVACISAGGMIGIELPDSVTTVAFAADNDENQSGEKAAAKAARRFADEGRKVMIFVPTGAKDYNERLATLIENGTKIEQPSLLGDPTVTFKPDAGADDNAAFWAYVDRLDPPEPAEDDLPRHVLEGPTDYDDADIGVYADKPEPADTGDHSLERQERHDPETGEITEAEAEQNKGGARRPLSTPEFTSPLDILKPTSAPAFPDGAFPPVISDFISAASEAIGTPKQAMFMAIAGACVAAIDSRLKIQPHDQRPDWTVSTRIWGAIIGPPSVAKTPAFAKAFGPIYKRQKEIHEAAQKAMAEYSRENDVYKKAYKNYLNKTANGETVAAPMPPAYPRTDNLLISGATIEGLRDALEFTPRGTTIFDDELSGWISSMDAYNSKAGGKDRAQWLDAYNGRAQYIARAGRMIHIENWSANVFGGIQPQKLAEIAGNMTGDGLLMRFYPVILPHTSMPGRNISIPAHTAAAYKDLIFHLTRIDGDTESTIQVPGEVAEMVDSEISRITKMVVDSAMPDPMKTHISKWRGDVYKWVSLLHILDCALRNVFPTAEAVSTATAKRAVDLHTGFFFENINELYFGIMGAGTQVDVAKWIAGHILANTLDEISNRDISQSHRPWRSMQEWQRADALMLLFEFGWIYPKYEANELDMRKAKAWVVNPQVHGVFADKAIEERKRRREIITTIQNAAQDRR